jgi:ATP-binding protein involved in chromosome partitioning
LLAALPLELRIREQTDGGNPTVHSDPESAAAQQYFQAARRMSSSLALQGKDYSSKFPKIVIEAG